MGAADFDVVTGALGYTGRQIASLLLGTGRAVKTLTGHPGRPNPFGGAVTSAPLNFERPAELTASLRGAGTLYNTYWVRFVRGASTFERAVENSRILIHAARAAGVRRVVHVSITNPRADAPWPYFRGKAQVEALLSSAGISYAILRPTVIFGSGDILFNNIAWMLRHLPVFAIPGRGDYRLQPVFVGDVARLAVRAGGQAENGVLDVAGPEQFPFAELVRLIARSVGSQARLVHVPPRLALTVARVIGWALGDVVITSDELAGLMANLLVSSHPPAGTTRLSAWLADNADTVGRRYASELQRHFR
jgi:NADH dehydrogenase